MVRLIDFVVCDDIREEKSGKLILVGAYPDGIAVGVAATDRPSLLSRLGLYIRLLFDADEPTPDRFRVSCRIGDAELFAFRGTISVTKPQRPVTMPLVTATPIALKPGELSFELTFWRGEEVFATLRPETMPVTFEAAS